jgi:hypothetical protein
MRASAFATRKNVAAGCSSRQTLGGTPSPPRCRPLLRRFSDCRRRVAPESARTTTLQPRENVSQFNVTHPDFNVTHPDIDTPKGTALMSWWPTLEWPDGRQSEIALEAARVSSTTRVGMFGFQAG